MKEKGHNLNKGFTLVELAITLAVSMIIFATLVVSINIMVKYAATTTAKSELLNETTVCEAFIGKWFYASDADGVNYIVTSDGGIAVVDRTGELLSSVSFSKGTKSLSVNVSNPMSTTLSFVDNVEFAYEDDCLRVEITYTIEHQPRHLYYFRRTTH